MSHTPARSKQTDIEHILISADQFNRIRIDLQIALETAVSDEAKVALTALMEIALAGNSAATQCHEAIARAQAASSGTH